MAEKCKKLYNPLCEMYKDNGQKLEERGNLSNGGPNSR